MGTHFFYLHCMFLLDILNSFVSVFVVDLFFSALHFPRSPTHPTICLFHHQPLSLLFLRPLIISPSLSLSLTMDLLGPCSHSLFLYFDDSLSRLIYDTLCGRVCVCMCVCVCVCVCARARQLLMTNFDSFVKTQRVMWVKRLLY